MASQKRSGNPAIRAQAEAERLSAKAWKQKSRPTTLDLPSGLQCRVKIPGIASLISQGLISDSLTGIVQRAMEAPAGSKPKTSEDVFTDDERREMLSDPKKITDLMDTFDRVAAAVIVEPPVEYYKDSDGVVIHESDRDEEIVYTDEMDSEDKMFIFNVVVGGTKDLEQFRAESGAVLDDMDSLKIASDSSK